MAGVGAYRLPFLPMHRSTALLFLLAFLGCGEAPLPEQEGTGTDAEVDRSWAAELHEVTVLGELPAERKAPFFVLRARSCTECDANLTLYVHSPSDGPVGPEHEQERYTHPGVLLDPFVGDTLLVARTFLGEVEPGVQGLLWHLRERDEQGDWWAGAYELRVVADSLQGRELEPDQQQWEALLREGKLRELPGLVQTAELEKHTTHARSRAVATHVLPAQKPQLQPHMTRLDPATTALLDAQQHPLRREIEALRAILLAADPAITEGVKWNSASYRTTTWFATLNGPRHVKAPMIILHAGARARGTVLKDRVPDPEGLLHWLGTDRAQVVFKDHREIAARQHALQEVVRHWLARL